MDTRKIIIFSEEGDHSTSDVMKWIITENMPVERVNRDDNNLEVEIVTSDSVVLKTSFGVITLNKSDVYWFRRANYFSFLALNEKDEYIINIKTFEFQEKKAVFESVIYWILTNCKFYFGNPFKADVHKIDILNKAQICKIQIPDWIVTNNRDELINFIIKNKSVAIKPFSSIQFSKGMYRYKNLTNMIDENSVNKIPHKFSSIFCQKYIEKKYELRIFYFNDLFFPMAILSQKDARTKIDFRDYNKDKPNRSVPFEVPKAYLLKLKRLIKLLEIDTGSFDILVDSKDNYYFLEVNTVGQFGMVSYPCNYQIERYIARSLINSLINGR